MSVSLKKNIIFWRYAAVLTLCVVIAAIPGFMLTPFSINFFDEPYQILNALDWKNSVYSPLSSYLAHYFGECTAWKYLAFRRLLIILVALSVYIASLYALKISNKRKLMVIIGSCCVYFATVFKSDMNIYGWDHWSEVLIVINIVVMLSLLSKWCLWKIVALGFVGGLTVLTRIPNLCIIFFCLILFPLFSLKGIEWRKILCGSVVYLVIVCATILIVLTALFGGVTEYMELFEKNAIGAHSSQEIFRRLFTSTLSVIRYLAIMLLGYAAIWFIIKKIKVSSWIKAILLLFIGVCYFVLIIPYSRPVLGNVIETSICFAVSGLILLVSRGLRNSEPYLYLAGIILFLLCSTSLIGSNWGFYKYLAWPSIPLIAAFVSDRITKPMACYSVLIGMALFAYSVYGWFRPTFFDGKLNNMTYRLSGGVLDGMYTSAERGAFIDNIREKVSAYEKEGYLIIPLRNWNDYIWEYIYLNFNPYQRHNFDNALMMEDVEYVDKIIRDIKDSSRPVLVMYMKEKLPETLMLRKLKENFYQVESNPEYSFFTNVKNF